MSNVRRSLETHLINCEVELSLSWIENCVLSGGENINDGVVANAGTAATFKITDAKLYVPVVTLSTEDNAKLTKQLSEGFKRPVYWNKYKVIDNEVVEITDAIAEKHIRKLLIQVIKELKDCLFLLMIMQQVKIKFLLTLTKNIYFQ